MIGYSEAIESKMRHLYDSLNESDLRRYAAIEAEKFPHGGTEYIAKLFDCDPKSIRHGSRDIEALPFDEAKRRVRKKGRAGRMLAARNRASSTRSEKRSKLKQLVRQ